MEKISLRFSIGIIIFSLSVLISILAIFLPESEILIKGTLIITLVYLVLGWLIFKGYYPEGNPLLLFLMGYLYSGIFIGVVFYLTDWPLNETIITITPFWVAFQLLIAYSIRKKIRRRVWVQFFIESLILMSLSIGLISQVYKG
jgi:hypothetical protein